MGIELSRIFIDWKMQIIERKKRETVAKAEEDILKFPKAEYLQISIETKSQRMDERSQKLDTEDCTKQKWSKSDLQTPDYRQSDAREKEEEEECTRR